MKSITRYLIPLILLLFIGHTVSAQHNGFLGRKVSVGLAPTFIKPLGQSLELENFSPKLSLNICQGRRGELSLGYRQGKAKMMTAGKFATINLTPVNILFTNVEIPTQNVQSFHVEQRLFRRSSEAPVGTYFGIGFQFSKYSFSSTELTTDLLGLEIPLDLGDQALEFDLFHQFYYTFGKKFVLRERLLLDVQIIRTRNARISRYGDILLLGYRPEESQPDTDYLIYFDPESDSFKLLDGEIESIKSDYNEILESNTRRRFQVHFSIHYLLF